MPMPEFTQKYMSDIGYHVVRSNIIRQKETLLFLDSIEKAAKLRIVKIFVTNPAVVEYYLRNLSNSVELSEAFKNLKLQKEKKEDIKKFISEHKEELENKKIIFSEGRKTIINKLASLFSSYLKEKEEDRNE